jgi:hypothetical protein
MKRNIYISYIHEESKNFKFKIMDKFKGRKYKFSDEVDESSIRSEEDLLKIAKKISHMDVTVVLLSRGTLKSDLAPIEIEYSLSNPYSERTKGVIGVVVPDKGNDYSYLMKKGPKGIWRADKSKLPSLISYNINNEVNVENKNNINYESFISIYRWEDFINDFNNCVNIAYEKANDLLENYKIEL